MDPMASAFAYYDYDETKGNMIYTAGKVQPKYFINASNNQYGYVTTDDSWESRIRLGGADAKIFNFDPNLPGKGNVPPPSARRSPAVAPSRAARCRRPSRPSACAHPPASK